MEILLKSKVCAFMEDVLITKRYSKPIPYAQIKQVIYEKRYDTEPFPEKRKRKYQKKRNESLSFCGILVYAA